MLRIPKSLTGATEWSSLGKAERQEDEGDDGLGQHIEDERDEREVVVVRGERTSKWAPGQKSKRKGDVKIAMKSNGTYTRGKPYGCDQRATVWHPRCDGYDTVRSYHGN